MKYDPVDRSFKAGLSLGFGLGVLFMAISMLAKSCMLSGCGSPSCGTEDIDLRVPCEYRIAEVP